VGVRRREENSEDKRIKKNSQLLWTAHFSMLKRVATCLDIRKILI
jgi:hypothetical protein